MNKYTLALHFYVSFPVLALHPRLAPCSNYPWHAKDHHKRLHPTRLKSAQNLLAWPPMYMKQRNLCFAHPPQSGKDAPSSRQGKHPTLSQTPTCSTQGYPWKSHETCRQEKLNIELYVPDIFSSHTFKANRAEK
ncbi:hypothetical protein HDV62DRAFT_252553 [Trichoderma sp. SZMC 28011]